MRCPYDKGDSRRLFCSSLLRGRLKFQYVSMDKRIQLRDVLFRHRQGYVAIRPHKISRVPFEAGFFRFIIPTEEAEIQALARASEPHVFGRIAIDVELPVKRSQWREIV